MLILLPLIWDVVLWENRDKNVMHIVNTPVWPNQKCFPWPKTVEKDSWKYCLGRDCIQLKIYIHFLPILSCFN